MTVVSFKEERWQRDKKSNKRNSILSVIFISYKNFLKEQTNQQKTVCKMHKKVLYKKNTGEQKSYEE